MIGSMWNKHAWLAATVLALTGTPAMAQEVAKAPETQRWVTVALAILLVLCVAVGSFMSSKRGHQD